MKHEKQKFNFEMQIIKKFTQKKNTDSDTATECHEVSQQNKHVACGNRQSEFVCVREREREKKTYSIHEM